jgi:peptide/nickel transport system permease protein
MSTRPTLLLAVLLVVALAAPWFAPYDPQRPHQDFLFAPPMRPHVMHGGSLHLPFMYPVRLVNRVEHAYAEDRDRTQPLPWFATTTESPGFVLGSDSFGRDMLSRLLWGARTSILLALASTLGAIVIGLTIGGVAGYRGGWWDETTMRVADFVLVLPVIYVVLVLRAVMPLVLPPSTIFASMVVIFAVVGWPFVARGVRAIVAAERDKEYTFAARSLGASGSRILFRHLLPACAGYLVVQATLLIPAYILAEATLSFVGLGFPEHLPTWGTMLVQASDVNVLTQFPWMLTPAAAIFAVVFSVNALLSGSQKLKRGLPLS